jgi:hypothetical protein
MLGSSTGSLNQKQTRLSNPALPFLRFVTINSIRFESLSLKKQCSHIVIFRP